MLDELHSGSIGLNSASAEKDSAGHGGGQGSRPSSQSCRADGLATMHVARDMHTRCWAHRCASAAFVFTRRAPAARFALLGLKAWNCSNRMHNWRHMRLTDSLHISQQRGGN